MYDKEIHFGKLLLNLENFTLVTLTFDTEINRVPLLCRMDVCTSLRKIGEGVLEFLIRNVLAHLTPVTLTFDPKINRIPLLPQTDVWTKIEEGRSRLSPVIDRKRFWLI